MWGSEQEAVDRSLCGRHMFCPFRTDSPGVTDYRSVLCWERGKPHAWTPRVPVESTSQDSYTLCLQRNFLCDRRLALGCSQWMSCLAPQEFVASRVPWSLPGYRAWHVARTLYNCDMKWQNVVSLLCTSATAQSQKSLSLTLFLGLDYTITRGLCRERISRCLFSAVRAPHRNPGTILGCLVCRNY